MAGLCGINDGQSVWIDMLADRAEKRNVDNPTIDAGHTLERSCVAR
jgi:hypothetical protein